MSTMNMGTHFDYSNHIMFMDSLTNKHLAHIKRASVIPEVNLLIQLFQTVVMEKVIFTCVYL